MPHGPARGKPDSHAIELNSDGLLSLRAVRAYYIRLCSLAEGFSPGRARTM